MHTMITVTAATLLLIGLVILLHGAGGRLRWTSIAWGLGTVAHAIGVLLTEAPGYLSDPGLLMLANVLIMASLTLLWSGTVYFMGAHRPAWLCLLPPLITLFAFPVFIYVLPSQPLRIVVVSILGAVSCGDSGRLLAGGRHTPSKVLGWFMLVASADRSERQWSDMVDQLRTVSHTDELTQLRNRRYMQERLEEEAFQSERRGEVFSLLVIDADGFKHINDTFGHECGDSVLRTIAHALQRLVPSRDLLARWGGEEFFVLVPDGSPTTARAVAERLRQSMAELPMRYGAAAFKITVTIGGATAGKGETPANLIRRADSALYLGKRRGRNRVEWG